MDPTIYHPYDHGYLLSHGTDHMSDLDDYVEYLQNSPGYGFLTERLTQTTRANEQRPRGNGNTRQEIEAIEVYRAIDRASQGLDIGTHGSDDVDDLYNFCNPSLSRDCVTEEVAARSTKPTAMARQSPRIVRGLQGPSFRVVMKNSRSNHAPSGQLSDRGSILRLRSGEESHRHSSNLRADTGSDNPGYDTSQASVLETLEEKAHSSRFSGSWSNPFSGEEFQYDTTASESTSEDQSVMYTNIRDTSVSNRHSSSFDNLHASRSHDLRHGQTSNAEGRSNPSGRRRLPQRTQFASRKSSPKLEVIQMRRSSAGDKRKRTDESCEGFLSTSHVLGLKAGHFAEPKKPISQGRTGPSGSQGYAELGSDFVYVEGKRIALPRNLPQPIRLNIQQYLEYHSPPSDTTPPSLSSSLLHFQQNRGYQSTLPSTMSPLLPIRSLLRTKCLVFTSELIPPSFDTNKREEILDVLRVKAPYVPACIMTTTTCSDTLEYYLASKGGHSGNVDARTRRRLRRRLALSKKAWLNDSIPVEIFENICGLLSQSDLRSMRLVNREFERKTSNIQFRSVVVPFGPEIYGMMAQRVADVKGKGKADSRKGERSCLCRDK